MDDKKVEIQIGNIFMKEIEHVNANNYFSNNYNMLSNKIGTFFDCSYTTELIDALDVIEKTSDNIKAKKSILDIRKQLDSNEPNVGIIQAAFNNLKRICVNDNFLKAVDVFGNLLIKAIK